MSLAGSDMMQGPSEYTAKVVQGLRESTPHLCWRPSATWSWVCIKDIGHDGHCGWESDDAEAMRAVLRFAWFGRSVHICYVGTHSPELRVTMDDGTPLQGDPSEVMRWLIQGAEYLGDPASSDPSPSDAPTTDPERVIGPDCPP